MHGARVGSHAQRNLLDLTLIEAALRSGQSVAVALAAKRIEAMPISPFARLFVARASASAKA